MADTSNKRIAKNTVFLYIRLIVIMLVSLYTSRIVLEELGVSDYGVYNVVGGVVAMFAFLNNCMTSSTQRFLNYELGRGSSGRLADVFKTSLTIHALIAVIVLALAETAGLWFVNHKLVIPAGSMASANVVYQASLLSFCVTVMQVPFNAAIIAHERMSIYAYISVIEAVLKLGIAFTLMAVPSGKLAVYGVLILVVHIIVAAIYIVYCVRRYSECAIGFRYHRTLFREMSGFAGWNLCGSIAWVIRLQGMGIILNMFYGPVLNAAKGVADQVAGAVNQLNSNFQVALNPQITKNHAQGRTAEMQTLTYRGIKFSSLLLLVMIVPIWTNARYLLSLWLTTVPDYTGVFVVLILADVLFGNLFGPPLMASISATGRIRDYQISVSLVLLLILPVSYLLLRMGFVPESVFYANIALNIAAGLLRFYFCKRQIGYSFRTYFRSVALPVLASGLLSVSVSLALKRLVFFRESLPVFAASVVCGVCVTAAVGWFLAFTAGERSAIISFIKSKIHGNGANL